MTTRRRRPPKRIAVEEMATILAYADLESDKAASDRFQVSSRTLQRYRAELRAGKDPSLAALVDQKKSQAAKRCEDLLVNVYERGLRALGLRIDDAGAETRMKDRDLVGAIHILGNQLVTRDVLTGDTGDEQQSTGGDRASAGAAAAGTGAERAAAGGSGAALH
jgi:hypothetical protein